MSAIIESSIVDNNFRITLEVNISRSMLDTENAIQDALNEAGCVITASALDYLDTDGSPIRLGKVQMTSKGKVAQDYETPYGKVSVQRHLYQSSNGGKTYCPMEHEARIVHSCTPRFASIVGYKYANTSVSGVSEDLKISSRRTISRDFIHEVSASVASISKDKEDVWEYSMPRLPRKVAAISLSLDGTCVNIRNDGWREVMVGTIALYDSDGERLYTLYTGESPEYGKSTFHERFSAEIDRVINLHPTAKVVGIADGAKDNWSFLSKYTADQCLDFYHASEYVSRVSKAAFVDEQKRKNWLKDALHNLKHNKNYAEDLILEMQMIRRDWDISSSRKDDIRVCQKYFENNKCRMVYAEHVANNLPIGSGVVEAGCKVLVKERLCGSGMRWNIDGCSNVLQLRGMSLTNGRWEQFWKKIDRFGFKEAA